MPAVWAAGAAAVGAVGSAVVQSNSASSASHKQQKATKAALAEQRRQYDQNRSDLQPYRDVGAENLGRLNAEIGRNVTPEEVMNEPGYQFGLSQGQEALDRKIAAAGGRVSGASLKAAAQYGTDYATTGYDKAFARRQDRLNRLQQLAGLGLQATGEQVNAGSQSANNVSNLITNQGDASAASTIAQGNVWGNAINSVAGAVAGGINGYSPQGGIPNATKNTTSAINQAITPLQRFNVPLESVY